MSTQQAERIILNDEAAVDWKGKGYYEAFSVKGEERTVWQRISTISEQNKSYYAVLAVRWQDLTNQKPIP